MSHVAAKQWIRKSLTVVVLLFVAQTLSAADRPALTDCFEIDEIRVLYTIRGNDAVHPADLDDSGVPDQVEDIARQAWAARRVFCDVVNFPDPLKSDRYRGIETIEISIRHRDVLGGGNGLAWEKPQTSALQRKQKGKEPKLVLTCTFGSHIMAHRNKTPAFHMFNHIQFGATYFKNSWYLLGMARWAEQGLSRHTRSAPVASPFWQNSSSGRSRLFAMRSEAEAAFWKTITQSVDASGRMPAAKIGTELRALRYTDGTPVLEDFTLTGAAFVRDVLIELGRTDDVVFKELGYDDWSEANQKSAANNIWIYQAVQDVASRHSSRRQASVSTSSPSILIVPAKR